MYKTGILIISERKELSVKYQKIFKNLKQMARYTNNLSEALSIIQKEEIEFIIISDTIKEKLSDFIKKIRVLTFNFRPIIIAVSKSSDLKDRLEIINSGADDLISEDLAKAELQVRFLAHIRRYIESFLNPITRLGDKNIVIKAIKQSFLDENNYSYLLIRIQKAQEYLKTHGEIAYEKVIKTLGAIINSTLTNEDFIGHLSDNEMFLITKPYAVEQVASFLTFAFDNILNKFYSSDEFRNKFVIQSSDEKQEIKTGLMRLSIASVEKNNYKNNYRDILSNLYEIIKLLDESDKSSYIIDRAKIQGEISQVKKNKVLIFEPDSALSCLLKNVCEINDIDVEEVFNEEEFFEKYNSFNPNIVLLDWGLENDNNSSYSLEIARKISKDNIKLIFSSSYLNKKEILKSGADLYIPKPYEIDDIIKYIKRFLD